MFGAKWFLVLSHLHILYIIILHCLLCVPSPWSQAWHMHTGWCVQMPCELLVRNGVSLLRGGGGGGGGG